MIKQLQLKNFQSHKNTSLEFGKGVNVIVGASDRGKSSVIRALQLLFFNRPGGTSFIRHGEKEAVVTAEMENGDVISRVRSSTKNEYVLNDSVLKAPGREVPSEVMDAFPMQEINVQGQHDAPFMLSESAGEVGRMLNQMVDLTVIDRSLSFLNSKKKEITQTMQFLSDSIKEKTAELDNYGEVDSAKKEILRVMKLSENNTKAEEFERIGLRCIEEYCSLQKELEAMPDVVSMKEDMAGIEQLGIELRNCIDNSTDMAAMVRGITSETEELNDLVEIEEAMKEKLKTIMGDRCPLCGSKQNEA